MIIILKLRGFDWFGHEVSVKSNWTAVKFYVPLATNMT